MTDDTIELNRRRVLGGIITIGGAAAAAGAGTFAAFSDTESSTGNTITAGTLNLELNPNTSGTTSITLSNIAPGDSGYLAIELGNTGSIDGNLSSVNIGSVSGGSFSSTLVTDSDGTPSEFNDPTPADGELDDNLEVDSFVEASGDFNGSVGTGQGSTIGRSSNHANVVSAGTTLSSAVKQHSLSGESLNSSELKYFVLNYTLPGSTKNIVQGDSVEFDVQFVLDQA